MGKKGRILTLAAVLVFGAAAFASAGEFTLGGGMRTNSYGQDLARGKYVDLRAGAGWLVDAGYRVSPTLGFNLSLSQSLLNEHFSDTYARLRAVEAGPRYTLFPDHPLRPFVYGGLGWYELTITGVTWDGVGAYGGAGIEQFAGKRHSVRLTVQGTAWTGKGEFVDLKAPSFNTVLCYEYHFTD
jgi:hypothetical protein